MTDNLPPLPKGNITYYITDSTMRRMEYDAHSDGQMQAYARAAIDAALAARGAVPAGWADEIIGLIEEYGSERATGAYHGEHFCHQTPADLLKKIRALLAAAPQQVAQPSEPAFWVAPERASEYHAHDSATVYRTPKAGWVPLFYAPLVAQAKPEQAAQPTQAACEQTTKKALPMLSISDEQAEAIASEVYARNPVDGVDAAFKLDWELVRAGISHAKALSTDDSCPHGNAHIVHDCLRCGAPVCCGKCCADDAAYEPDAAGEIAYQLTKKLVIDMPTARAAVDAAISALKVAQPLTPAQRRELIDSAGDKTDGLNQDDFAEEIVLAVERHHGIAAPQKPKD